MRSGMKKKLRVWINLSVLVCTTIILSATALFSMSNIYSGLKNFAYYKNLGRLGLIMNWDSQAREIVIRDVQPGSNADNAGLLPGDKITAINGVTPVGSNVFSNEIWGKSLAGESVTLTVVSGGKISSVKIEKRIVSLLERLSGLLHGVVPPLFMFFFTLAGLRMLFKRRDLVASAAAFFLFTAACYIFSAGGIGYGAVSTEIISRFGNIFIYG